MGLKPDSWIVHMAHEQRMIEPFAEGKVRPGVISFGVSSYGYDIRIADETFKDLSPTISGHI